MTPNKDSKPTQTWTTFLRNHVGQLVSIDFFTVATIRLQVLYVFIVLAHDRRRIVHFNVTQHSTAVWAAQQIIEAFPEDRAPRFMVRNRDGIYGDSFTSRVEGMGIEQIHIAPRSPWQNGYVERVIGSVRRECLNHVIVFNDNHLRRLLKSYFRYYHESRTHVFGAGGFEIAQLVACNREIGTELCHFHVAAGKNRRLHNGKASVPISLLQATRWLISTVAAARPTTSLKSSPPRDPNVLSIFLNHRVTDIMCYYDPWSSGGTKFITEPKVHATELRCYMREPDGYLIEVGQTTMTAGPLDPYAQQKDITVLQCFRPDCHIERARPV